MSDISKIDKNFTVNTTLNIQGIKFRNCLEDPFAVYGITHDGKQFIRMPSDVAKKVSDAVYELHYNTAGGRIRFKTDSPYVAISVKYVKAYKMSHFAFCGSIGFDLYADGEYVRTFIPPTNITDTLESVLELGGKKMREITINFPLYSSVENVYVGLDVDAKVEQASPYSNDKPIVYYGSSITQGGCASRPGTCYQAHLSREFNADYINLGFSGSARAEDAISDYIRSLDMCMFVYDYDHNAPSVEHLQNTHEKMFLNVREAHPDIPIIIMSAPKYHRTQLFETRMQIIKKTYENAIARGDKNVYFLSGTELFQLCGNEGTVDGTHPTDFGFASMARTLSELIKREKLL